MIVFLNDRYIKSEEARISPFDRGFLTGEGLFETMRVYSGLPFALDRHLNRLARGAFAAGIKGLPSQTELAEIIGAIVERNHLKDARLRVTLTKGVEGAEKATLLVSAMPFDGYPEELYREGMSVTSLSGFRSSSMPVFAIKTTSYLVSRMAYAEAKGVGFDEAILFNERGEVAEGSTSNVFAVFGDRVVTPAIESGALPGITRAILMDILPTKDIEAGECVVSNDDLRTADEIFLTNSLMEIMPVTRLDGARVGDGAPGSTTIKITRIYKALVAGEISSAGG